MPELGMFRWKEVINKFIDDRNTQIIQEQHTKYIQRRFQAKVFFAIGMILVISSVFMEMPILALAGIALWTVSVLCLSAKAPAKVLDRVTTSDKKEHYLDDCSGIFEVNKHK